jgi:hypothetical protein
MKGTVAKSTILLPLILATAEAIPKKKSSGGSSQTSGGNQVTTNYDFKKDSFGANSILNLGVQTQIKGGNTKSRRDLDDNESFELYVREAEPKKKHADSTTSGGNQVSTNYNFSKDKFGTGSILNLGVQSMSKLFFPLLLE